MDSKSYIAIESPVIKVSVMAAVVATLNDFICMVYIRYAPIGLGRLSSMIVYEMIHTNRSVWKRGGSYLRYITLDTFTVTHALHLYETEASSTYCQYLCM